MRNKTPIAGLAMLALGLATSACSPVWSVDPVLLDDPLGASVKHTLVAQMYDPEAAAHPDPDPVMRFDPYKANNTLQDYRLTAQQRENIRSFNVTNNTAVGGGGGGGGGQ